MGASTSVSSFLACTAERTHIQRESPARMLAQQACEPTLQWSWAGNLMTQFVQGLRQAQSVSTLMATSDHDQLIVSN